MNKKIKTLLLAGVLSISMIGCSNTNDSNNVSRQPIQQDDNAVVPPDYTYPDTPPDYRDDCPVPDDYTDDSPDYVAGDIDCDGDCTDDHPSSGSLELTTNGLEWKGHVFNDYVLALSDEEFLVLVKKVEVIDNTICFTYSFYNEGDSDTNPAFDVWSEVSQGKTANIDAQVKAGPKRGNEHNLVKPGTHVDDCYTFAFFNPDGDRNVKVDMFIMNHSYPKYTVVNAPHCIIIYNLDTGEFSIS